LALRRRANMPPASPPHRCTASVRNIVLSGAGGLAAPSLLLCLGILTAAPRCQAAPQWIAKQQLARQGTKCFWREPVGQQKSAQRQKGRNQPFCGVPAGTEDDPLCTQTSQADFTIRPPAAGSGSPEPELRGSGESERRQNPVPRYRTTSQDLQKGVPPAVPAGGRAAGPARPS
jgi:hypothetical protein